MDSPAPSSKLGLPFKAPKRFFSDLDAAKIGKLISAGVDIALVIENGIIKDAAFAQDSLIGRDWRGRPWKSTVTVESHKKIEDLLKAAPTDSGRWRQVNHPTPGGGDVPIQYVSLKAGDDGRIYALGRDLRSVSHLQQRLVQTHQELEEEYASLRDLEAKYRHLFEVIPEPMLIVDASTKDILEINPTAKSLILGASKSKKLPALPELFVRANQKKIEVAIDRALATGESEVCGLHLKGKVDCSAYFTAFRQGDLVFLIVRLDTPEATAKREKGDLPPRDIHAVIHSLPDALVVTTGALIVLSANKAFLKLVRCADERQVIGQSLSNWVGGNGAELSMLMSNLKHNGVARNFSTVVRDRFSEEENVEVSAVTAELGGENAYGFALRSTTRRMGGLDLDPVSIPSSAERVASLVGKMPMKEIVREWTDLIEKLCIETALEISKDSRASAAEILGLSRQGLYSKLKRFDITDDN